MKKLYFLVALLVISSCITGYKNQILSMNSNQSREPAAVAEKSRIVSLNAMPDFIRTARRLDYSQTQYDEQDKRKTVCTITINSSNERELFEKKLSKDQFKFVELTLVDQWAPQTDSKKDWFERACESKINCDMLIVSGHFGGVFFGSSGKKLSFSDLENQSCRRTCDGILSNPKEVFLFGCNTLASKDADARTRDEYIAVLMEDGYTRQQAEETAETRYGATGETNRDRMRRSFLNVPYIYGFKTKAPLGASIAPFLSKYLDLTTPYEAHIDQISKNAQANASTAPNQVIQATLANIDHKGLYQCPGVSGMNKNDPYYEINMNMCQFYTLLRYDEDKILFAMKLLRSGSGRLYFPAIIDFFFRQQYLIHNPQSSVAMNQFTSAIDIKKLYIEILPDIISPVMRSKWLVLGRKLNWLTDVEYQNEGLKIYTNLMSSKIDNESSAAVCSMEFLLQAGSGNYLINPESIAGLIKPEHFTTKSGIQTVYCSQGLKANSAVTLLRQALKNAIASNSPQLSSLIGILDFSGISNDTETQSIVSDLSSVCGQRADLLPSCLAALANIGPSSTLAQELAKSTLLGGKADPVLALGVYIKAGQPYPGDEMDIVNIFNNINGYLIRPFGDYFAKFSLKSTAAKNMIASKCVANLYYCTEILPAIQNAVIDPAIYMSLIKAQVSAQSMISDNWAYLFNLGVRQSFFDYSVIDEMLKKRIEFNGLSFVSQGFKNLMNNQSFVRYLVKNENLMINACQSQSDFARNAPGDMRWGCLTQAAASVALSGEESDRLKELALQSLESKGYTTQVDALTYIFKVKKSMTASDKNRLKLLKLKMDKEEKKLYDQAVH